MKNLPTAFLTGLSLITFIGVGDGIPRRHCLFKGGDGIPRMDCLFNGWDGITRRDCLFNGWGLGIPRRDCLCK